MIEKVWKLTEKGITDYNGKVGSLEEVVQVLNDYHFKQNQDLKNRNNLQSEIQNLKKENEELKKENERLKERVKQLQINNKVITKIYKTFYKPRGIKYA